MPTIPGYMVGATPVTDEKSPSYMEDATPAQDADAGVIANSAADLTPERAAKTLQLSRATGLEPDYLAPSLDVAQKERDRAQMAAQLDGRPTLKMWAGQSAIHAAAIRRDVSPLGRIEGWLSGMGDSLVAGVNDIAYAEAMRQYMNGDTKSLAGDAALNLEDAVKDYDARPHGFAQSIGRATPQMVMYGALGYLTGGAGVAGLMYVQNKGVLARQIQQAQPLPPEDTREHEWVKGRDGHFRSMPIGPEPEDKSLTPEEIDKYATIGSAVSAVTLAGLLGPTLRSLPGVRGELQGLTGRILARGAATTVGQAALRSLLAYGQHTLMGALGMTLQNVINDATVQKATKGNVDFEALGRNGIDTFLHVLPVAATFAAYGPGREFLEDRGRINAAGTDSIKLNDMMEKAKQASLARHSPDLASELFGAMGRGARVYIDAAAARANADSALLSGLAYRHQIAEAEVTQGTVSVPLGDYLAKAGDIHESIKDDVKTTPDGYTVNEARAREEEVRNGDWITPAEARALYGKLPIDELQGLEMPIAADLTDKQKTHIEANVQSPGTVRTANDRVPAPRTEPHIGAGGTENAKPLHVGLAEEYGGTPQEWAERLTPELLQAMNEEGSLGAVSPEEHAARIINAMPIDDIDPNPFKRLSKKASKYIQEAAEKARSGDVVGAKKNSIKDVVALSTYELAKDLNDAKAKRAADVQEEMQKGLDKLLKQSGNGKLRAQLNLAGGPLLHLFDALIEGVGAHSGIERKGWLDAHNEAVDSGLKPLSPEAIDYANQRMAAALDEARQWFDDNKWFVDFDEGALQRFLSKPKAWGSLTPPEARNILDAVNSLTKASKEQNILRKADAQATVREIADDASAQLKENPDKGLPQLTGSAPDWQRDRLADANAANALMLRPKNNFRQKSIALKEWVFDRINDAIYARDALFRLTDEFYKKAFDDMPKEIAKRRYETYDLSKYLPTKGTEPATNMTRQWLWKLGRHWGSAGNVDRIVSTSGWDKDVLSHLLFDNPETKLTIPEWDFLQKLGDHNENEVWPHLKEHFEKYYGAAPPKVAAVPFKVRLEDGTYKDYAGGYEPLKRDARPGVAPQAVPTKGIAQYWGRDVQIPWTPGSVRERLDSSHYLVNMDWDSSRAHMGSLLHWLAFDQPVRDVAKLFNDPSLSADMNQYMGQGRADMARAWLKSVASQQSIAIPEGQEMVAKAFGLNRRLALMRIVGGSARLAIAQLSHPFGLMLGGEVNPLHGIPALLSTFKPLTMENGEVQLFPNWNKALDYSNEVQHRADNAYSSLTRNLGQIGERGNVGILGKMRNAALGTAGLFLHAVDRLTTTWAWESFHNEAVSKFKMDPYSPEAVAYADGKTQDVMPVHDKETAAPILTNQQVGGFLIMHGFKNTLYQFRADAVNASVRDFHNAETPGQIGGAIWRTSGRVALQAAMYGGFAIMGKLALGAGQQEDETKGQWLARDALGGQTVDLPFIGGLGEPLAKLIVTGSVSRKDFSIYENPGMSAVNSLSETLGQLTNENREDSQKVFDALQETLFLLGLPSRPVRNASEYLYNILMGESPDEDMSGGRFIYNEQQLESIKRSLSPEEGGFIPVKGN